MAWEDDIAGVKDVLDGTGSVDITLPRRAKLRISGNGAVISDDPVDGVVDLVFTASPGTLTSSAPADVTKAAAAVGVDTTAARADHKHDISVAAPVSVGTANSAGVATSLTRSDHVHAHGDQTVGTLHAAAIASGTSGFMTGADKAKLDGIAASAAALTASAPADVTKAAAAVGVATAAARADHKHDISTAAPATIGTSNAEGSATSLARSDHVHDHGAQTSGTLHAAATTSVNGFQSSADKLKQDATGVARSTVQTTDATPTVLATATPADETLVTIRATICGLQSDGSNGVGYAIIGTFRRDGGTTVQVGTTTAVHTAEDAALTTALVAFNVSSPDVQVLVTGVLATTINWACVLETITVP